MTNEVNKTVLPEFVTNVKKMSAAFVAFAGLVTTIWAVSDRLVTDGELQSSEDRIIAEVRSESAKLATTIIEDMEARLDKMNFDILMLDAAGEPPNEALIIERNNLERRIEDLKSNEGDPGA